MPKSASAVSSYRFLNKMNHWWLTLVGSPAAFPLESRIFHSISICLLLLAVFYIPYNLFAGLYVASLSCFLLAGVFGIQFYNSRFRARVHNSTVFGLTGIIIFSVNYFSNAGITGSTDLIWPAYLLLVLAISPYRQQLAWLVAYLLVFLFIHLVEYHYPNLVKYPFSVGRGQFIDRVTAFPIPAIAIYVMIRFIRRSYDRERITAEQKAKSVEIRNQQILLQKEELEQTNLEKNKLMSIISHDLRAPLINIQNYLELLSENELDSRQRPDLEQSLLTATNQTMQMLSNLLYWSKTQMEGPSIHLQEINLLKVLQGTLEMEKMQASKKSISMQYHIGAAVTVIADTDMLQLVARNLISNAIKFTPKGGSIHVEAAVAHRECKITVRDNGQGIDQGKQAGLFSSGAEPSYGTNNEKGVGLGLLLCKEFMERQGGRIGFESTPGLGSSFYIFIPAA